MNIINHKELDHARIRDDKIVYKGNWVQYLDYDDVEKTLKIEKIVHNRGGAVLFFEGGIRAVAENCWVQ